MSLTPEQIRATAEAYVAALDRSDTDALAALYAEGAAVEDPVGSPVREGNAAIGEFYGNLAGLRMDAKLLEVRVCGRELLFNFELVTHFDENTRTTINVWDNMVLDDEGKVLSMKAYWGEDNVS
ncbi:nuclear transport factor 2 family protein [Dietzia sp.]|uniref:nuclear transport factor 2 family protein n=1 Tax=Dietzia sp. TaxID=1871616 RepID=UPI002FDA42D3